MPASDVQSPIIWAEGDLRDAALMAQAQQDDHDAFTNLLPRLGPAIDAPLRRRLPPSEIDDGRAEVHLRIWARRMQYRRDRGTVRAWAGGISRFHAIDCIRRHPKSPHTAGLDGLAVADGHPGPALAAEEADWAAHARRVCSEVLAAFPSHVRECFTLRMQGTRYADIALAVCRPAGTVASAVHKVKTRLIAALKDNLDSQPCLKETPVSSIKQNNADAPDLDAVLAQLAAMKADLAATQARLDDVEARVPAKPGEATFIPDTPADLATELRARVREMIEDAGRLGSDTDLAEALDLADGLAPALKRRVVGRLKEARELLKMIPRHRVAISQLREVERILVETGEEGPGAGGVTACP